MVLQKSLPIPYTGLFSSFQLLSFWRLHQILVNLQEFTCNQLIDDEKLIDRF